MIKFESLAKKLGATGICVTPNFLNAEMLQKVLGDLKRIYELGEFKRAGIGKGIDLGIHDQVRRDEIFWLDELLANLIQKELWKKINFLKQAFNRTLYLGLKEFEGHYASYPKGGFYKRHLDSFKDDDKRTISIILYLNNQWKSEDGGVLRIHDKEISRDIEPIGGTLVCFLSREFEHEVLLNQMDRFSFTGWFKN